MSKARNSQRAVERSVKSVGEASDLAKKTAAIVPQAIARFIEQENLESSIFPTGKFHYLGALHLIHSHVAGPIEWSSRPPVVLKTTFEEEGFSVTYSLPGIFGTLFERMPDALL
jgi:hypothetical protein